MKCKNLSLIQNSPLQHNIFYFEAFERTSVSENLRWLARNKMDTSACISSIKSLTHTHTHIKMSNLECQKLVYECYICATLPPEADVFAVV